MPRLRALVHCVLPVRLPLAGLLAIGVSGARALPAQGTVGGQVVLMERPDVRTDDLDDVVAWLEPAAAGAAGAARPTEVALRGRKFIPRVRVVAPGSTVRFPNEDSFSHNVFSRTTGATFDTGTYLRGQQREFTFRSPGVVPLYCNIHPRMTAYVVVTASPWVAQAGEDGRFAIAGVPAGRYTLHVWHDRAPELTEPVTVSASGLALGRLTLDARGYHFVQHRNKFGLEYTSASGDRY